MNATLGLTTLAGLAAVVAGATALPVMRRQRAAARDVASDLRSPLIRVPVPLRTVARVQAALPAVPLDPRRDGVRVVTLPAEGDEPDLDLLVHEPATRVEGRPAVMWLHGGGYVAGSARIDTAWCARLAEELGAVVVGVEYRLAPAHPFPAALDDAVRALRWIHAHADDLGVVPARVAVGGDSAGGGLAAATVQRAHDEGVPVRFQALVYPMLDDRTVPRAEAHDEWTVLWSPAHNRYGWTSYLGREPGGDDLPPYAAPARRTDLTGLPPAWVGVGEIDLFHDEDVAYAARLRDAGVEVNLHVEPGMWHGADMLIPGRPRMVGFRRRIIDALATALTP